MTPPLYEENFLVSNPAGLDEQVADTLVIRLVSVPAEVTIIKADGYGVQWHTGWSAATLLKIVRSLTKLGIQCGAWLTVLVEAEGDKAPRLVVDEVRRALTDCPPMAEEMLEYNYVRFTPPPLSGKSKNYRTLELHAGVSSYAGRWLEPGLFELDTTWIEWPWDFETLETYLRCGAPAFFVAGPLAGIGPDKEPFVSVERWGAAPRSVALTAAPVKDKAMSRWIADSVEIWNRADYDEKRGMAYFKRKAAYTKNSTLHPAFQPVMPVVFEPFVAPSGLEVDRLAGKLLAEWKRA